MPKNIKSGVENHSGALLNEFKVDGNINKPTQLSTHTFTQENKLILIQEKKIVSDSDWHSANRKQIQVSPSIQMKEK